MILEFDDYLGNRAFACCGDRNLATRSALPRCPTVTYDPPSLSAVDVSRRSNISPVFIWASTSSCMCSARAGPTTARAPPRFLSYLAQGRYHRIQDLRYGFVAFCRFQLQLFPRLGYLWITCVEMLLNLLDIAKSRIGCFKDNEPSWRSSYTTLSLGSTPSIWKSCLRAGFDAMCPALYVANQRHGMIPKSLLFVWPSGPIFPCHQKCSLSQILQPQKGH
jgi:hypothetical protein